MEVRKIVIALLALLFIVPALSAKAAKKPPPGKGSPTQYTKKHHPPPPPPHRVPVKRLHGAALLQAARAYRDQDKLDHSAKLYHQYLKSNPHARNVMIEYALVEAWADNYRKALRVLKQYRKHYGVNKKYLMAKGETLALAGRYKSALKILDPLYQKNPNNYNAVYYRAYALGSAHRTDEAVAGLKRAERLNPRDPDLKYLRYHVMTPIRSKTSGGFSFAHENATTTDIAHWWLRQEYYVSHYTSVIVEALYEQMKAKSNSGFDTIDGHTTINDFSYWGGLSHRFTNWLKVTGLIGALHIQRNKSYFLYRAQADLQVSQTAQVSLLTYRDLYRPNFDMFYSPTYNFLFRSQRYQYYSPRSVSLAVIEQAYRVMLHWEPYVYRYVDAYVNYSDLTDDNSYWKFVLAPNMRLFGAQHYHVEVGLWGEWYWFRRDRLNGNGYFDPNHYQSYQVTAGLYFYPNDIVTLSLYGAAGVAQFRNSDTQFAGDLYGQIMIGTYSDWRFGIRAGIDHGGNFGGTDDTSYIAGLVLRKLL